MPSIRVLRTFLVVARHGSFAAAGLEVGLTPAAVAHQIHSLEEDLGQVLFDRSVRSIGLNTAGRAAIAPVADLIRRYESLGLGRGSGLSGTVLIGALVSSLMGAFADALWTIKGKNPQLDVKLFAGFSADLAPRVAQGELDAAVVTQTPRAWPRGVKWTKLYAEPMILIAPVNPHFTVATTAAGVLQSAPYLRFERSSWTGHLVDKVLARTKVQVNDAMELNSIEAIMELVRQGFGVSIVPRLHNVNWHNDAALQVIALPGTPVMRNVGLLERISYGRPEFTEAVKQHFKGR